MIRNSKHMLCHHKALLCSSLQIKCLQIGVFFDQKALPVDPGKFKEAEGVVTGCTFYVVVDCGVGVCLDVYSFQVDHTEVEMGGADAFIGSLLQVVMADLENFSLLALA